MKLEKALLKSIALGLAIGVTPSCDSDSKMELDPDDCVEGCSEQCEGTCANAPESTYSPDDWGYCIACGMG